MARAQHASGSGLGSRGVQAAIGGTLVVAVGVGVWLVARDPGSDGRSDLAAGAPVSSAPASSAPPSSASTSPSPAAPQPGASPAPAALVTCARSVGAAEAAVAAAQHGVDDWSQHVQAYRDVVARAPGAATAESTWDRTAQSGPSDAAAWTSSSSAYAPLRGACRGVVAQAGPEHVAAAQACTARSTAADAAVRAAAPVLQGWADHLDQSHQRHAGMLSDARANALLAATARRAPAEIAAAQRARDALAAAPACAA